MAAIGSMLTSPVLNMVKDQIDSATTGQITLQWDLGDALIEIKTKLEEVEGAVKDAERIGQGEALVWLERIRTATYDISDMIYELEATAKSGTRKANCLVTGPKITMANVMKKMKDRLNEIADQHPIYRSEMPHVRGTSGFLIETQIIGRSEEKQKIMDVLSGSVTQPECTQQITVLPIYGIGGIGKTILAQLVYNSVLFKYNSCVWVFVSPSFDLMEIGNSIISQLSSEKSFLLEMGMIHNRLQELLVGRRTLVVLDDLWENDPSKLEDLKSMLTFGQGAIVAVLVTTRDEAVARGICTVEPYKLAPLTDSMCWSIIKERCRPSQSEEDKEHLEQIGIDIAMKCAGIPFAAIELGRMLAWKPSSEWEEVRNSHVWSLMALENMHQALMISYNHMPPYLKLCFAYCAILPRGHCIVKEDLINQLISVGFIESSDTLSPTQTGENYVRRLLELSFLQHANTSPSDTVGKDEKSATLLTMPDLIYSIARLIMNSELIVVDDNGTTLGNEYSRYALLTRCDARTLKLSSILPARMRALHLLGSSKLELTDDSFLFAKCLRVLELKESSMQKLPDSISLVKHLGYLNLSGCSQLVTLPESFGDLVNLLYLHLSDCSQLVSLPESFGDLINLLHINLSGCSQLVSLPESFGNLLNLLRINLSGCSRLPKLPESIKKLTKLVYLDLSFWYCFGGISGVLTGLASLQHLNLAHPSSSGAEHRSVLEGLCSILGQLTQLKYLNLSMFFNDIFYYRSETYCHGYIQSCISGLSSLQHLDLSHNIYLFDLPESLGDLNHMQILDLSGCIRLRTVPKRIYEMRSLKLVLRNCRSLESCQFVVRVDEGAYGSTNNLAQLEVVDCKELEISCLEKLKSLEEAQRIRLVEKQEIKTLKLCWSVGAAQGQGSVEVDQNALLGELAPPHSLQSIKLHGYGGETCHPAWWIPSISSHLANLVEVTMENFPSCTILPPLGLIPNLQRLVLRGMPSITRIDVGDLSGGNKKAFSRLSKFTIDDMKNLQEFNSAGPDLDATCYTGGEEFMGFIFRPWKKFIAHCLRRDAQSPGEEFMDSLEEFDDTTCYSDEKEEFMFPVIDELDIKECPELSCGPLPPRARRLMLSDCDQVMLSWQNRGGVEGSSTLLTTALVVERCNVPCPSLGHHFPGLQTLIFSHCDNMTSLPEDLGDLKSLQDLKIVSCQQLNYLPDSMKQLSSLQSIHFSECEGMTALPEWFEHLTSLMLLTIDRCPAIESLPQSIGKLAKLKGLNISGCPRLKTWCELDENKSKLAHIRLNFGEIGTSSCSGQ